MPVDRYNGLLNVYKEAGFTSNDVVAKLRGICKQRRIGHTGTLDPDAVGVLVVCLGSGTRAVELLTEHTKEYIAVCRLGITTDTQDLSGRVIARDERAVSEEELKKAIFTFQGEYDQIPPMYSALKVGGKKLYELARAGMEVERRSRKVTIFSISLLDASQLADRHEFTMEVKCSKGTYIRTLCHDIGLSLGCGGAMAHLTRTAVGSFHLEDALTLSQLEILRDEGALENKIVPVDQIFRDRDYLIIDPSFLAQARNGNPIPVEKIVSEEAEPSSEEAESSSGEMQEPIGEMQAPIREIQEPIGEMHDPIGETQEPIEEMRYQEGEQFRLYDPDGCFFGLYRFHQRTKCFRVEKFFYRQQEE